MILALVTTAAHWHVLLNHLPIAGLGIAALGLLISISMRNRGAQIVSLLLIVLTCASVWPIFETGENAYKPIRGVTDDAGAEWLDTHMDRAEGNIWWFAVPAALAALTMVLPQKFPRSSSPLLWLTLLTSGACLALAAWIAEAGGQIRHPEFREVASSKTEMHQPHHDEE